MPQQLSSLDLGLIGYTAYGLRTKGRTHDGRPMPDWKDLGPVVQRAWAAAAVAIADAATPAGTAWAGPARTNAERLIVYRRELLWGGIDPTAVEAMVRDAAAELLRRDGLVVAAPVLDQPTDPTD